MTLCVKQNVSLRTLNTFGVEIFARYFTTIQSEQNLTDLFNDAFWMNINKKFVLGGGSNVLFVDKYFDGLVLHMCVLGISLMHEENGKVILMVGGGEKWVNLITFTVDHGYCGLEQLAGIPGTVGAAPVQNIGAYGRELSDVFVECRVFDVHKKCFIVLDKLACQFGYRTSIFKKNKAMPHENRKGQDIVDQITRTRSSKLPDPWLNVGNAGSFFLSPTVTMEEYDRIKFQNNKEIASYPTNDKNRIKIAAGWLIEQCGWKNKHLDSAAVWHCHANVLIKVGTGTGKDVWTLAKEIRASVENQFGIHLRPEVNIIRMYTSSQIMVESSSRAIISKSDCWKTNNTMKSITIPLDTTTSVYLIFSALALGTSVRFSRIFPHQIGHDIMRVLEWIDEYNLAEINFEGEHDQQSLEIVPRQHFFVDLRLASFIPSSICLAGSILLRQGLVHCGRECGFELDECLIDRHLDLLEALGDRTEDNAIYHLNKHWGSNNEEFYFDCRSKDGLSNIALTIHAVLSCCALSTATRCILTYVSLEAPVRKVIELATQYHSITVSSFNQHTIIVEKSDHFQSKLGLQQLPIDQTYLFIMCVFAATFQLKLTVINFEYDPCITEYLKSIIQVTTDDNDGVVVFDGASSSAKNKCICTIICDIYPNGLPEDISSILTAFFATQCIGFKLVNHISDISAMYATVFYKLGYASNVNGNCITYDGTKRSEPKDTLNYDLYAYDIHSAVAILLLAVYEVNSDQRQTTRKIVIHNFEHVERRYGDFMRQNLCELGFNIELIRD